MMTQDWCNLQINDQGLRCELPKGHASGCAASAPTVTIPREVLERVRETGNLLLAAIDQQLDLEPFEEPHRQAIAALEGVV